MVVDLPPADLYIATGDMIPNFMTIDFRTGSRFVTWAPNDHILGQEKKMPMPAGVPIGRHIDPVRESDMQGQWVDQLVKQGGYRAHMGSPDAQVVCVRGNHDFVDLAPLFGGRVWEVPDGVPRRETHSVMLDDLGIRVGGVRGINRMIGEWSDELLEEDFNLRARALPDDLDILISHSPPNGMMDNIQTDRFNYGSQALRSYVTRRVYSDRQLRGCFFGHLHESNGSKVIGPTLFSNAATTFLIHDI
jgi:Icc-related predicted phosphoesterase